MRQRQRRRRRRRVRRVGNRKGALRRSTETDLVAVMYYQYQYITTDIVSVSEVGTTKGRKS